MNNNSAVSHHLQYTKPIIACAFSKSILIGWYAFIVSKFLAGVIEKQSVGCQPVLASAELDIAVKNRFIQFLDVEVVGINIHGLFGIVCSGLFLQGLEQRKVLRVPTQLPAVIRCLILGVAAHCRQQAETGEK